MAIIEGTSGDDRISTTRTVPGQPFATNLDDILNGYDGDDWLNGAAGADEMTGGAGNDRYYVDNVGDVVTEAENEGSDTVYTIRPSCTLEDNVEEFEVRGIRRLHRNGQRARQQNPWRVGCDDTLAGGADFHELVTVTTAPTTIDAHTLLAFVSGGSTILYVNNTDTAQVTDAASTEILLQGTTTLNDFDLGYYPLLT